eukprot:768536-Hanusia_phi.AAC.7
MATQGKIKSSVDKAYSRHHVKDRNYFKSATQQGRNRDCLYAGTTFKLEGERRRSDRREACTVTARTSRPGNAWQRGRGEGGKVELWRDIMTVTSSFPLLSLKPSGAGPRWGPDSRLAGASHGDTGMMEQSGGQLQAAPSL